MSNEEKVDILMKALKQMSKVDVVSDAVDVDFEVAEDA
jgi:hypothetical protein